MAVEPFRTSQPAQLLAVAGMTDRVELAIDTTGTSLPATGGRAA